MAGHRVDFSGSVKLAGSHWVAEVFSVNQGGGSEIFARASFSSVEGAQRWARETAEALEEAGDLEVLSEIDDMVPHKRFEPDHPKAKQAGAPLKLQQRVRPLSKAYIAEVLTDHGEPNKVLARNIFKEEKAAERWVKDTAEALELAGKLSILGEIGE